MTLKLTFQVKSKVTMWWTPITLTAIMEIIFLTSYYSDRFETYENMQQSIYETYISLSVTVKNTSKTTVTDNHHGRLSPVTPVTNLNMLIFEYLDEIYSNAFVGVGEGATPSKWGVDTTLSRLTRNAQSWFYFYIFDKSRHSADTPLDRQTKVSGDINVESEVIVP